MMNISTLVKEGTEKSIIFFQSPLQEYNHRNRNIMVHEISVDNEREVSLPERFCTSWHDPLCSMLEHKVGKQ